MTYFIQRLALFLFGVGLLAVVVSCGGSSSNGDPADNIQGKGTVGILLTDMPADPTLFASINATIEKVELLGSEENGRVTLYSGGARTFDLLRLRNESIPLTFKDDVPAGIYCKIRLTLSDLELVLAEEALQNSDYDETYHPKLPGNGKLDLVVRDCFTVVADEVVTLQLDMDAGRSIHVIKNNKGFNFRPVIFIDVVNATFDSKLVRLTGKITKIDTDSQSLLLCDALPNTNMDNLGCVKVHFGDDSALFDNLNYDGAPRPLDELLNDENPYLKMQAKLTVVGWPKFWVDPDAGDKDSHYYPLMQLDALVAELGKFLQVEGSVVDDLDLDPETFAMKLASGNPIKVDEALAVMSQQGSFDGEVPVFNGTRIVSKSGELLNRGDVIEPLQVQVDGILEWMTGTNPLIKAALIVIDQIAPGAEQVTGVVVSVMDHTLILDPDADTVCGVSEPDDLTVTLVDDFKLLTVTITEVFGEIAPGGELAEGQIVGMSGTCGSAGYYDTDNVVIIDDQRTQP